MNIHDFDFKIVSHTSDEPGPYLNIWFNAPLPESTYNSDDPEIMERFYKKCKSFVRDWESGKISTIFGAYTKDQWPEVIEMSGILSRRMDKRKKSHRSTG